MGVFNPRAYQTHLSQAVDAAHAKPGVNNVAAVLATGGGKTVIFSKKIQSAKCDSVAIAHRKELVVQMSAALAREEVPHKVIGPKQLVKDCVAAHMEKVGRSYYEPSAHAAAISVDTLVARKDDRVLRAWAESIGLWVQDECFPAGTDIEGTPIERVRVGMEVSAYNEATHSLERRRVVRLFKNPMPAEMVRVQAGHHVLECTKGHPFYTQEGWKNAGDLTNKDYVLTLQGADSGDKRGPTLPLEKNGEDILQQGVRVGEPPAKAQEAPRGNGLQLVRREMRSKAASSGERSGLLRGVVRQRIPCQGVLQDHGRDEQETRFRPYARAQPHALRRVPGEGFQDAKGEGARTRYPRGQRGARIQGGRGSKGTARTPRLPLRGSGRHGAELSEVLHTRRRARTEKSEHRSGWAEPWGAVSQKIGCSKGCVFSWQRVGSVEVYKPSDTGRTGDGFVYNFEVEGLHTYVAGGVVVHNCHHVLRGNKWGTACDFFPNAKGLGVTATPCRADGKGLGRSADGVFDEMVIGPPMRDLINLGYLTDYRVISARTQDLNLENVGKGKNGDYSQPQLKKAARKSRLVGDAVDAYLKYTPGKLAVVFATDLESADDLALKFKGAGVAAAVVSANSTNAERAAATAAFARREIKVLINVDLFGEGYDLPAIEVVIMARPTESFGLYCQQFGRALRLMISRLLMDNWESFTPEERRHYIATSEKPKATIIDHVGNVVRHGLPDAPRAWSLDGGPESNRRGTATDAIPLRTCLNEACLNVYERSKVFCPYCGHTPVPTQRSKPEHVEGDLFELDEETLARMRGEVFDPQKPFYTPQGIGQVAEYAARQRHARKAQAHEALTASIGWWAQIQRDRGIHDRESHKKFWHLFGVDVLTARNKNLSSNDAIMLAEKINQQMVRELSKCS